MTIDDLENLESSIEQIGLRQLRTDYSTSCPDGVRSLHNFMATSPTYAHKIKPSAQLIDAADTLVSLACRVLFPKSPKPE